MKIYTNKHSFAPYASFVRSMLVCQAHFKTKRVGRATIVEGFKYLNADRYNAWKPSFLVFIMYDCCIDTPILSIDCVVHKS